jgi:hypothetical protein
MARVLCLSSILFGTVCSAARADHFAIDLDVQAAGKKAAAHAQAQGSGQKAKSRPVLHLQAGQRVAVKWLLTNTHTKATFKDVIVHFFVVREEHVGQQTVPKLGKTVQAESALTMDFRPGDKTRGEVSFVIDVPGAYLLRLETVGAAVEPETHEHYSAIDLVVEASGQRPPAKEQP